MTTFASATSVTRVDSHTYSAYFHNDWCIGSVPHGGFVTSVFLNVASAHFKTTLAAQNQPHTISLHLEFLRRTQEGPATFKVKDLKLGRQISIIQIVLVQDGHDEVEGYFNNSNLHAEAGPTFDTAFSLQPPPAPVDLSRLQEGQDLYWTKAMMPFPKFRRASQKVHIFTPKSTHASSSLSDHWLCFSTGERFTNKSLGYVADMFISVVDTYQQRQSRLESEISGNQQDEKKRNGPPPYWYPTLLLNLDVKKALPDEGVQWLFSRVRAKQIKNGRMDLELIILDETGDIIALSHHVCLILDANRNTAKRTRNGSEGSKI